MLKLFFIISLFYIISQNKYTLNMFGENDEKIGIPILMEFDAIRP